MSTSKIYYVTKYALTTGIMKIKGAEFADRPTMLDCGRGRYFHGNDWHTTMDAAEARVAIMVQAKFKSLRKQEAALEAIRLNGAKIDDRTK